MNKKGILGIGTVKAVILSLLVISLFVITGLVVASLLVTTTETINSESATAVNDTILRAGIITNAGTTPTLHQNLRNVVCSAITMVYNGTTQPTVIALANFTQSGCVITNTSSMISYGATNFLISYPYTYDSNSTYNIYSYLSTGSSTFFGYVPTFLILLAVVVIILIISIVIVVVTKFGGGGSISVSGGMFQGRSSFVE